MARVRSTTLEEVRQVAADLAAVLRSAGEPEAAAGLEAAVRFRGTPPEELLEVRSALVVTRSVWPRDAADETAHRASEVLKAAKRLAIDM